MPALDARQTTFNLYTMPLQVLGYFKLGTTGPRAQQQSDFAHEDPLGADNSDPNWMLSVLLYLLV